MLEHSFGSTARQTLRALRPMHLAAAGPAAGADASITKMNAIARIAISLAVVCIGGALLFQADDKMRATGAGLLGTVLGYWLK